MNQQVNPDMELAVEFFVKAVQNDRETREQKRPIFEDREYIRIRFPGDNKRELVARAHEMHYVSHAKAQMTYAERFSLVYDHFKKNHDSSFLNGTPLGELMFLTEAKRAELRSRDVKTVEQLASLPTTSARNLGVGGMELVRQAQDYLDNAKDSASIAELRAEIAALKAEQEAQRMAPPPAAADERIQSEFVEMTDEDLKNMLTDAGVAVDGRWKRATLEEELRKLAKAKEAA